MSQGKKNIEKKIKINKTKTKEKKIHIIKTQTTSQNTDRNKSSLF